MAFVFLVKRDFANHPEWRFLRIIIREIRIASLIHCDFVSFFFFGGGVVGGGGRRKQEIIKIK